MLLLVGVNPRFLSTNHKIFFPNNHHKYLYPTKSGAISPITCVGACAFLQLSLNLWLFITCFNFVQLHTYMARLNGGKLYPVQSIYNPQVSSVRLPKNSGLPRNLRKTLSHHDKLSNRLTFIPAALYKSASSNLENHQPSKRQCSEIFFCAVTL